MLSQWPLWNILKTDMDTDTLYKTMVMKLLALSGEPLSTSVITDFFSKKNYTNYFTIQQALYELKDQGFISPREELSRTYYSITDAGRDALSSLSDRITKDILSDIESYLLENQKEIRAESSLFATYDATVSGFSVRLTKTVNDAKIIDLTFPVPTKEAAENICINWKSHSDEALESLYESLLK